LVWAAEKGLWVTLGAAAWTHILHWLAVYAQDPLYAQTLAMSDMKTYWEWAREIAAGDWLGQQASRAGPFYYGPLYAYFLGVLFQVFGESYHVVHAVQALLGLLSPVLLWSVCRRLFGKGPALATGVMAALCAPILFYEQTLLTEGLLIAVSSAILWLLVRGQEAEGRAWLWALGAGALSGIACWGRGNFLLVIPALAGAWLVVPSILARRSQSDPEGDPGSRSEIQNPESEIRNPQFPVRSPQSAIRNPKSVGLVCAAACVLGAALLLSVTLWRNHHVSGQWVLTTSNGPILLYAGNASDSIGLLYHPPSLGALKQRYAPQGNVPWIRELLRDMAAHPLGFARLMLKKTWLFWNSFDAADNVSYYAYKRYCWLIRFSPVTWLTLVPLAILGIWETRKQWRRQVFLYVYGAAFSLSIIAVFVVGRYRLGEILPLLVWAGPAVTVLCRQAWNTRWMGAGARALVLAAGVAVLWPAWSPAVSYNNPPKAPGYRLIGPNHYNRLAIAHLNVKNRDQARELLEEGVALYPFVDMLVLPLATVYVEEKKPEKAAAILETYVHLTKGSDKKGILALANALAICGQRQRAVGLVQDVLRKDPNDPDAQKILLMIQGGR
jgi:tetratricopeptide (TPR) repeat protein